MRFKWQGFGFMVLFLLFFLGLAWIPPSKRIAGEPSFTTLTGESIAWPSLRGRLVLVAFWATDCPSCIAEIPHLVELYRRYHQQGLEIIAIAMYYDPPSHVVEMAQAKQLPYPVVLDLDGRHARAFGDVNLTPTTFLIDRDGNVVSRTTGLVDQSDMWARIEQLSKG